MTNMFKVGDQVRVLVGHHGRAKGSIGTVQEDFYSGSGRRSLSVKFDAPDGGGCLSEWFSSSELEPVTVTSTPPAPAELTIDTITIARIRDYAAEIRGRYSARAMFADSIVRDVGVLVEQINEHRRPKWEIGARVRVVRGSQAGRSAGEVGIIDGIDPSSDALEIEVRFDTRCRLGSRNEWFDRSDLELLPLESK